MTSEELDQRQIIRINVLDYPWQEVDVVCAPGHVTRYRLWTGSDGSITGEIKTITTEIISTRVITDQDIVDLGLLLVRTQWGLKRKRTD
jgi:hypothetical protein